MIDFPNVPDVSGIAINSELHICKEIPWDSQYKNVRLFSDKIKAWEYVTSKEVLSINCTTVKNNKIRVSAKYSDLIAVANYLCFKNDSNMFFAFILEINYISSTVAELTYKLDIFQTYYYNCNMLPCFVEREHINRNDDKIGVNVLAEPLDTGITKMYTKATADFNEMGVCIYHTVNVTEHPDINIPVYKGSVNNVFSGIFMTYATTLETAQRYINEIVNAGLESSIALIQMSPKICGYPNPSGELTPSESKSISVSVNSAFNYTPINKKCYTFPYCYAKIDNNSGQDKELYFECSSDKTTINLYVTGTLCTLPTMICYPTNYNNFVNNINESMSWSNFPTCATTGNAFAQFINANGVNMGAMAQCNALSNTLSYVTAGISAISSLANRDVSGIIQSGLSAVSTAVQAENFETMQNAQYQTARQKPNNVTGNVNASSINTAINRNQVDLILMGSDTETIKKIDNFFSVYGYNVSNNKMPNLNNRNIWNYVKTRNCTLQGTVAFSYLIQLQNIFNNGVFIWHSNDIGNFDVDNNG
jgi:hypothetical protein|nr:MAG TPA_asm: Major tail protein [Caudoviricetes sp.]